MSWLCHGGMSSDSEFLATHIVYCLIWQVEGIIGRLLSSSGRACGGCPREQVGGEGCPLCDVAAPLSSLAPGRWTLGERREGLEMLSRGLP